MTPERWQRLKHVIESALEREPPARGAFLAEACGEDVALRAEAESFVAAHDEDPSFLEAPAWDKPVAIPPEDRGISAAIEPGRSIGAYQIVRPIASGGMGAVFLAVRADDAYRKQVAIKVIRTDSYCDARHREELLRRFRTERQTLANLDHPNIARLLDGGTTDDGLPYLVMEYIEGLPIDQFCDERRLSTSARLELFRSICQAVNYAHRSLVIHRDLKPGNILVTADGVPKLLDFGLAKLLDRDSSALAATLTQTGRQPMTPAYASPEQIRGQPVTTSTDVYSLGVVLFELLTGHRPYQGQAMHEIARLICEQEPIRPSTAVAQTESVTSFDGGPPTLLTPESVSRLRNDRPERLRRRLSGDVDMIVLKALRKEPEHRYPSADLFAEDIRRHLEGEPVLARKGTLGYRAAKFIRRHKIGVLAAALVVISLVGGLVGTIWQMREAERQTRVAQRERDGAVAFSQVLKGLFRASNPGEVDGVRRPENIVASLEQMLVDGQTHVEKLKDHPLWQAELQNTLGLVCRRIGRFADARAMHEKALETQRRERGRRHPDAIVSMNNLGICLMELDQWEEAASVLSEAFEASRGQDDLNPEDRLHCLHNLARALRKLGQLDESEKRFREALAGFERQFGLHDLSTLHVMNNLGVLLWERNKLTEAEDLLRRNFELKNQKRGAEHPATLNSMINLASVIFQQDRFAEAEPLHRSAYDACQRILGDEDPQTLKAGNNLAQCLVKMQDFDQAERIYRTVLEKAVVVWPKENVTLAMFRGGYGECLSNLGRCDEAEKQLSSAYQVVQKRFPPGHQIVQKTVRRLAESFERCGDPEKASEYRSMLTLVQNE